MLRCWDADAPADDDDDFESKLVTKSLWLKVEYKVTLDLVTNQMHLHQLNHLDAECSHGKMALNQWWNIHSMPYHVMSLPNHFVKIFVFDQISVNQCIKTFQCIKKLF